MHNKPRFVVGMVCLAVFVLCLVPIRADEPAATRPATRPVNWFALSPDEFAQTEAANQPLPWEGLDDRLLSAAILHETNRHRVEHNLHPLRHMPRLDDAAAGHSADMAEGGWFSHEHPDDPKKRTVMDRVKRLGLNPMFVGENIAAEHGIQHEPGRRVFEVTRDGERGFSYEPEGELIPPHTYASFGRLVAQRWMDSPPHRENMLTPHARFLGSAARPGANEKDARFRKFYITQVFFAPMPRR